MNKQQRNLDFSLYSKNGKRVLKPPALYDDFLEAHIEDFIRLESDSINAEIEQNAKIELAKRR